MNWFKRLVWEFHVAFDHPRETKPQIPKRWEFRARFLASEVEEFRDACKAGDMVKMIDALCDIRYVLEGTEIEAGLLEIEPFYEIVHLANMKKFGGGKDKDGKTLKPPGWEPPEPKLAELLEKLKQRQFQIQDRVYHRDVDKFGMILGFDLYGEHAHVKYDHSGDMDKVLVSELRLEHDAAIDR